MSDVTRLLDAAAAGDRNVAADLLPLVYDELRKLAATRMAAERPGHTLDATALVHDAHRRLIGPTNGIVRRRRGDTRAGFLRQSRHPYKTDGNVDQVAISKRARWYLT